MAQLVICIASSEEQAAGITNKLKSEDFSKDDISVLFSDKSATRDFAHERNTKTPEGIAAGASSGGVLGAAIGWLSGVGALAIPGLGPLIAAGPIMGLLSGAGIGAAIGGVAGALVGMGIPEYEARRYEGKVKEGNILISVHTDNKDEQDRAKEIFKESGAEEIATTGESSMSSELGQNQQKDSTISTTDPKDPEVPGKEEPRV